LRHWQQEAAQPAPTRSVQVELDQAFGAKLFERDAAGYLEGWVREHRWRQVLRWPSPRMLFMDDNQGSNANATLSKCSISGVAYCSELHWMASVARPLLQTQLFGTSVPIRLDNLLAILVKRKPSILSAILHNSVLLLELL
jgi:hypothetical protein